jgi:hypothetical protein
VRKTYLLAAVAGVLALAFAAVAIASPQLKQTAKINYSSKKPRKSAGITATLEVTDPGAQPAGNVPGADLVTVRLRGAAVDTRGGRRCTLSKSQAASCPANTKISRSGEARANIVGTDPNTGQPVVLQNVFGGFNVTAYLKAGGIYFVVQSKQPGGPTTILDSSISRRGTLTTNVKRDVVPLPGGNRVVLTYFRVKLRKSSRGRGRRKRTLLKTPRCPRRRSRRFFRVTSSFKYSDGTSKTVNHRQRCRRR